MEARFQDETDGSLLGGPRAVTGVGDDTETVCAGRKVAVNSGSRAGRFVPLAVISLEQVTEPDAIGRTEADGGELHLYGSVSGAEPDLLRRSGPEPAARGHLFDHDAGGVRAVWRFRGSNTTTPADVGKHIRPCGSLAPVGKASPPHSADFMPSEVSKPTGCSSAVRPSMKSISSRRLMRITPRREVSQKWA